MSAGFAEGAGEFVDGGEPPLVAAGFPAELAQRLDELKDAGLILEGELDDEVLGALQAYPVKGACEVLDHFARSLKLAEVNNKSAYLTGVLTRHKRFAHGPKLPSETYKRLEAFYKNLSNRGLRDQILDAKVLDMLSTIGVDMALRVIDVFEAKELEGVRNFSALFMSTTKTVQSQWKEESRYGRESGGQYQGGGGMGGGRSMGSGMGGGMSNSVGSMGGGSGANSLLATLASSLDGGGGGQGGLQSLLSGLTGTNTATMTPDMLALIAKLVQQQQQQQPPPMMPSALGPGGKPDCSMEQMRMGVRINEFHNLSPHAKFVSAEVAKKLQALWDDGCVLVSLLDDATWKTLADLETRLCLQVVSDVADTMAQQELRNVNAFFMSTLSKVSQERRTGGVGRSDSEPYSQRGRPGIQRSNRHPPEAPGDASRAHASRLPASQAHASQAHANRAHASRLHASQAFANRAHASRVHASRVHASQARASATRMLLST